MIIKEKNNTEVNDKKKFYDDYYKMSIHNKEYVKEPEYLIKKKKNFVIDLKEENVKNFNENNKLGKCMTMCPVPEIKEREERYGLSIFEIDPESCDPNMIYSKRHIKHAKAEWVVKKFVRSAADRRMDDKEMIRPPSILVSTLNYLFNNVLDADKFNKQDYIIHPKTDLFSEICSFWCDRTRAIRQDFSLQEVEYTKQYIESHERIARFLLLCANQGLGIEGFDKVQNSEQLTSTLTSLREAYKITRDNDKGFHSKNEAEFYAYSLLWQIHQALPFNQFLLQMPKNLIKKSEITLVMKVLAAYNSGNYIKGCQRKNNIKSDICWKYIWSENNIVWIKGYVAVKYRRWMQEVLWIICWCKNNRWLYYTKKTEKVNNSIIWISKMRTIRKKKWKTTIIRK